MECEACGSEVTAGMRFCGMCGAPLSVHVHRERRNVSVVFIDLAGFTTLTRGLDPEELRDLADEVLTSVAAVIEEFAGHVDSFRGDGLVAVFGAPRAHADDAERAVNAAAAGLRAIERIGDAAGSGLRGRAGVSTGTVIAGEIGSGRVREYTVMGSAVNLAARVEAAATPGEVWVSPATHAATRARFNYEASGPVQLAGFPDISELYVLRSDPEPVAADPFATVPFLGRQEELAALQDTHRQVITSGRAAELWVAGDPGIGKSRLLREFVNGHLAEDAIVLWPVERSGASLSWAALARTVFAEPGQVGSVPQQAEVEELLQRVLPDEPRWHRQVLASLGHEQLQRWTRQERRRINRTSLAWRDLLAALTRTQERSLLLVLDLPVQDAGLAEFVRLLKEAEAPILIVRATRSAERPDAAGLLRVPPLSREDSLALLNEVAHPVMRRATEALVYQVGGVPSHILELGRTLSVTDDSSFSGSLEAVLQARLDGLAERERAFLALAALVGERSWEALLLELGGPGAAAA
ncbi:MAG TPA: adenylate/guanylate cyclase domain-containing protein, partial [Deinococcales bacterium]|nr:adenylate/guanylate cyclase domain-containing protein [Deinococcales bacterium]